MDNFLKAITAFFAFSTSLVSISLPKDGDIIEYYTAGFDNTVRLEEVSTFYNGNNNIKKFMEPVIRINFEVMTEDGGIINLANGTGFSVSYDNENKVSYVITNAHICELQSQFPRSGFSFNNNQTMISGTSQRSGNLYVIDQDAEKDLCLMITNYYIRPAKIAGKNYHIKQMDEVTIVGAPNGVFPIVIKSSVTNLISKEIIDPSLADSRPLLMISSIIFGGQSGSPIFNKSGEVIGVVFVNLNDENGPIYGAAGIHLEDVREFLEKNDILD